MCSFLRLDADDDWPSFLRLGADPWAAGAYASSYWGHGSATSLAGAAQHYHGIPATTAGVGHTLPAAAPGDHLHGWPAVAQHAQVAAAHQASGAAGTTTAGHDQQDWSAWALAGSAGGPWPAGGALAAHHYFDPTGAILQTGAASSLPPGAPGLVSYAVAPARSGPRVEGSPIDSAKVYNQLNGSASKPTADQTPSTAAFGWNAAWGSSADGAGSGGGAESPVPHRLPAGLFTPTPQKMKKLTVGDLALQNSPPAEDDAMRGLRAAVLQFFGKNGLTVTTTDEVAKGRRKLSIFCCVGSGSGGGLYASVVLSRHVAARTLV